MSIFKVEVKGHDLALYADAGNAETAVKKVERLVGPLPRKDVRVKEVPLKDVPDGESVI